MAAELIAGYVLYVDGRETSVGRSLDEAKQLGTQHMSQKKPLRIESAVAPAPTQVWNYDYEMRTWVGR